MKNLTTLKRFSGSEVLVIEQKVYWNQRFIEGEILGEEPFPSAVMSIDFLREIEATNIFVPGCGYGRNSLYFGQNGLDVFATDISDVAINQAIKKHTKLIATI